MVVQAVRTIAVHTNVQLYCSTADLPRQARIPAAAALLHIILSASAYSPLPT
jgi:hypothetical protein|eukprot:COSAG06_NODE_4720_length_4008_cov_3.382707_1_plen_52_part_00